MAGRRRDRRRDNLLEANGWHLFAPPMGGKFIWARLPQIDDSQGLVECAAACDVAIATGAYFRPNSEASPWIRINAAYAQDRRAQAFFAQAGALDDRRASNALERAVAG